MPKMKIVFTEGMDLGYYDERQIVRDMTDWEEVTDEELALIHKYKYYIGSRWTGMGLTPHLVVQDEHSVSKRVNDIRELVRQAEEQARLAEKKKAEAKKKRLLSKKEKMKQEFERLKKKLGEDSDE